MLTYKDLIFIFEEISPEESSLFLSMLNIFPCGRIMSSELSD